MPVNPPTSSHFLYRFEAGSAIHGFSDIALDREVEGVDYEKIQISHTQPAFGPEAADAEIEVVMHEQAALSDLFINGPAPYAIRLRIYEYDNDTEEVTPYYRGWVVRAPFRLTDSLLVLRVKSAWQFYERESLVDSLAALSRYSIYDPRAGVDAESLRVGITVTGMNDLRDVLTVTGITQPDDWFSGGIIRAPDEDKRTILKHVTEGLDKKLYLNAAFPEFTLTTGFNADIFPGDDLRYSTWTTKFASLTDNGAAHGGWPFTPDHDPAVRGVS